MALYIFDCEGNLIDSVIDDLGPRHSLDEARSRSVYEQRLADIGDYELDRISIRPFSINRYDTTFGLIPCEPDEDNDEWTVEVQPGNYMCFIEPWDSGEYDT